MRSALCTLLLGSLAVTVAAQETQVSFEEPQPVTVTGFVVGRADYNRAARTNDFAAGKIAVSLFKAVGDAYVFGQLTTALEEGTAETEIDNLIVSWTPHATTRWTLAFGRFDAPVGFERDDEPLNFLPTNSFNFELARPAKLTGVAARFTASPRLELWGLVANGWNQVQDNNRGKTALARLQWIPLDGLTLGAVGAYGPERDGSDARQRSLVATDLTLEIGRLIVGVEASLGRERDPAAGNPDWGGAAATAFVRLARTLGVAARYDYLEDSDSLLTGGGTGQILRSFTAGPMLYFRSAQEGIFSNIEHTTFHLPQVAVRAAVRFDRSSQPFFPTDGGGLRRTDTHVVAELIYLF